MFIVYQQKYVIICDNMCRRSYFRKVRVYFGQAAKYKWHQSVSRTFWKDLRKPGFRRKVPGYYIQRRHSVPFAKKVWLLFRSYHCHCHSPFMPFHTPIYNMKNIAGDLGGALSICMYVCIYIYKYIYIYIYICIYIYTPTYIIIVFFGRWACTLVV